MPTAAPTAEPTLPVPPAATEEPLATEEPTLTPDATETALPTETTEPAETASGPMSLLASAVEAYYWYDGDGALVKSQIDGVVTYYTGRHYHKKVDGQDVTEQKFYTAGSSQVAARTITGGQDSLTWILSDHLGSVSVTANADGTFKSETKYTAFGETRPDTGTSDTPYQYTGQLSQMQEIGLYYFVARFYDPYRLPSHLGTYISDHQGDECNHLPHRCLCQNDLTPFPRSKEMAIGLPYPPVHKRI